MSANAQYRFQYLWSPLLVVINFYLKKIKTSCIYKNMEDNCETFSILTCCIYLAAYDILNRGADLISTTATSHRLSTHLIG